MQHAKVFVCYVQYVHYANVMVPNIKYQSSLSNRLVAVVMLFYYPISLLKDRDSVSSFTRD